MPDLKTTAGPALGKVPSGLAICTAQHGDERTAFLASWYQQVSFEPPLVMVCIKTGRPIEHLIEKSGAFALNLVAEGDSGTLKRYAKGFELGADPWSGDPQALMEGQPAPVLAAGYAHLVLKHVKTLRTGGDHHLFIGEVTGGALQDAGKKPHIHIRRDGFGY